MTQLARLSALAGLALSLTVSAGAEPGTQYGESLTEAPLVSIAEMVADPDAFEGKRVRVQGVVTDVCPKRGCWMNIGEAEGFEEVIFKVHDGVIVVPMSAKGQWTIAEGIARKVELSLERTRSYLGHLAMEKGEDFDPASVTEPKTLVRLMGTGAVIRPSQTPRP